MKRVLVIGGSYFVGRKIVDYLKSKDYHVTVLNRGSCNNLISVDEEILCDRNNEEDMIAALKNKSFNEIIDVSALDRSQVKILLDCLNLEDVNNFVFISSSAVYDIDNIQSGGSCIPPYTEYMNLHENKYWTSYGQNKIEAEKYLREYFKNQDTNLYLLRPPYMYGENNYAKRESMIFDHILSHKPIIVPGNGETKIQFLYTKDLARIIEKLINTKRVGEIETYNVGNKEYVTFNEWIECCFEVAKQKTKIIHYIYDKDKYRAKDFFPFDDYDDVLDVAKIHKIIDEETSFIEGLKICYNWYVENKNDILMKENVTKNEFDILKKLKY